MWIFVQHESTSMDTSNKLIRKKSGNRELDSVSYRKSTLKTPKKDVELYDKARKIWENMSEFREQRARGMRFCYGDQWGDIIEVCENGVKRKITMRQYLSESGQIPIQTNQLKTMVNTIVGVLIKEQNEPICNAIDKDEQQYGELLTMGLQANNNKNRINQIYKLCALDMIIGGLGVLHESYGYCDGNTRREDSWTKYIDPNYLILETSMRDPRFWDVSMIGCWYRMPFRTLVAQISGRGGLDYNTIKDIYSADNTRLQETFDMELTDQEDLDNVEFMTPLKPDECCVAEIWTRETKERVELHDTQAGEIDYCDADDTETLNMADSINKNRIRLARQNGWQDDEVSLIEKRYFIDEYWYCRFLAPDGTILWEGESPLADRSHPFTVMATPFIDGRIAGYIIDGIDHQIAINRATVLQDWIARNQVKGFVMMPQQLVPDHKTNEQFMGDALQLGNFLFYDAEKYRGVEPKVFHPSAVNYDATAYISQLKQLMDSSSAVTPAIQGKVPYSGTSAALYAQQTMNSSTPIASLLSDIHTFLEDSANKKAKNIAKFYDKKRWEQIAGRVDSIFDNANLNLNDIADLEFDVIIKESTETPVYRAISNDYLMSFFQAGAISLEELLENGTFPFSDKILQKRQARQAEMEAAQNGEMGEEAQAISNQQIQMENPVQTQQIGPPVKSTRPLVK